MESTASWLRGGLFEIDIIDQRPGIAVTQIRGKNLEFLKNERGGHRWQRIPPTERNGRVQTSTVTVAVLEEPSESQFQINPKDLDWKTTRGSGPGGQNRNKLETAVLLKHIPTGTVVRCESERSQFKNKQSALEVLKARLFAQERARIDSVRSSDRKSQVGSGQRGDKRRTIRVRDNSVVDHVTGREWDYDRYIKGIW